MDVLLTYLVQRTRLSPDELEVVLGAFREIRLTKSQTLLRAGQRVFDYYFIVSGALRFYLEKDEREITGWVAQPHDFFTELESVRGRQPSRFTIQALDDTVLLAIPVVKMHALYDKYPAWQQFGRQLWEEAFLRIVDGILAYQMLSAEERYRAAMQAGLLQRVPLKDLSSYLGITPTSLSRIRKNSK